MSTLPSEADIGDCGCDVGYKQPPGVEPRVLAGGLFLGRCRQDRHQVGERIMAGAVMEHVPAFLAEQQKHLFRWAVASNTDFPISALR